MIRLVEARLIQRLYLRHFRRRDPEAAREAAAAHAIWLREHRVASARRSGDTMRARRMQQQVCT